MWYWWIAAGVLVLLIVVWFLAGGKLYRQVFADAHFQEVAEKLPALKQAAIDRQVLSEADLPRPPHDPRILMTSVGLAVLYTITPEEAVYHHHLSISLPERGYTAHAVGDLFTWYLARLLGIEIGRFSLGISPRTVHHAVFTLSRPEQDDFVKRPVTPLSARELADLRQEWTRSWKSVRWERLPA